MKIIEAMRKIKINLETIAGNRDKIAQYCADYDIQDPTYPDQASQVRGWLTSTHDLLEEISRLKAGISATNLATKVTIELPTFGRVTKSITEWVARRDTLSKLEAEAWQSLTDKGLRATAVAEDKSSGETRLVKIRRYFDPKERDAKVSLFKSEPHLIDGALEVANATTDLI